MCTDDILNAMVDNEVNERPLNYKDIDDIKVYSEFYEDMFYSWAIISINMILRGEY